MMTNTWTIRNVTRFDCETNFYSNNYHIGYVSLKRRATKSIELPSIHTKMYCYDLAANDTSNGYILKAIIDYKKRTVTIDNR